MKKFILALITISLFSCTSQKNKIVDMQIQMKKNMDEATFSIEILKMNEAEAIKKLDETEASENIDNTEEIEKLNLLKKKDISPNRKDTIIKYAELIASKEIEYDIAKAKFDSLELELKKY